MTVIPNSCSDHCMCAKCQLEWFSVFNTYYLLSCEVVWDHFSCTAFSISIHGIFFQGGTMLSKKAPMTAFVLLSLVDCSSTSNHVSRTWEPNFSLTKPRHCQSAAVGRECCMQPMIHCMCTWSYPSFWCVIEPAWRGVSATCWIYSHFHLVSSLPKLHTVLDVKLQHRF